VKQATDADWDTEYEDAIIAAKVVDGVDGEQLTSFKYRIHGTGQTRP